MAINKNFVIKNGAEINTKLLVADADTQKVGIGTTRPSYTLHVMGPGDNTGGIGATYIYTTGITTTQALNVLGVSTFNAGPILLARGEQTGTPSQSLQVGTATTVSGAYISGNLGLANTNPTSTLHVVGNALITGVTTISGGISLPQGADLARLRVTGITTLGQTNTTGLSNAGVSTLGDATASTAVVTGFSTLGGASATLLNVSGIATVAGGFNATQGGDLARLRVTGITTLGDATSASIVISGVSTLSGGLNASQGADLARLRVTGITTLGQTNTTGLSNAGVSTLGNATASTLVVSGFTTESGGTSAALLVVSGVSTFNGGLDANQGIDATGLLVTGVSTFSGGFNASQGADLARLRVTGITTLGQTNTTGLSNAGVSTLGNATASTLVVSGFTTESGGTSATLLTVSGVATVSGGLLASQGVDAARLRVTGITTLGDATATNLSLAGITTGLNASGISTLTSLTGTNVNYSGIGTIANLRATNANVSGVTTTDSLNVNSSFNVFASNAIFSNDVTINGNLSIGGTSTIINAASLIVEDKDLILGFTTSQLPTDTTANHGGIAVASTEGTPLVTFAVTGINTLPPTYKQIMWVKSNTMGAGTTDAWLFNYSVGIGSTLVPNNVRLAVGAVQITEDAINARVGNLTHVRSTNINATGITTTNSLSIDATQVISSARQLQNIASLDATTTATIEAAISNAPNTFTDLNVTGFSTLAAASATLLNVSGVTTVAGGVNASQGADLARLRVTGITTLGQANVTGLSNAGVSTLGNATASTLNVSGVSTLSGQTLINTTSTTSTAALVISGRDPGTGIYVNTGTNTSGIATASYGLFVEGSAWNNATAQYGVFAKQNQQLVSTVYGGYFEANAVYSPTYGIYAKATKPDTNSNTFAYGLFATASGTSSAGNGGSYGAWIENTTTSATSSSYGLVVNTQSGPNTVVPFIVNHANTERLRITSSGNLLIGSATSTGTVSQPLQVTGGAYVSGSVGIGTTITSDKLDVSGGRIVSRSNFVAQSSGSAAGGSAAYIRSADGFSTPTTPDYTWWFNDQVGLFHPSIGNMGITIQGSETVRFNFTGVGIGSTTPTSKLDVAGDVKVIGIVTATGGFNLGIQTNGVNVTTGVVTALNFVGTGNTITYNAGTKTVSINIAGSAGGGGGGGVTEIKTSGISTTNPIGVGSFATATYRSASVVAQINQNAQYQVGRYLMIHDGTTVTVVEEGAVSTGSSMLGTFTGAIVGSNAELRVSLALPQSTAGVATVTTKIDTITL